MPSAICSPYWCLAGSEVWRKSFWRVPGLSHRRRRRPLHRGSIRARQIPNSPKISANFFSNTPIDLLGEEAPPGKTRAPPSRSFQKKTFFWAIVALGLWTHRTGRNADRYKPLAFRVGTSSLSQTAKATGVGQRLRNSQRPAGFERLLLPGPATLDTRKP